MTETYGVTDIAEAWNVNPVRARAKLRALGIGRPYKWTNKTEVNNIIKRAEPAQKKEAVKKAPAKKAAGKKAPVKKKAKAEA